MLGVTPFVLIVSHHGPVIQAPDARGHFLNRPLDRARTEQRHDLKAFLGLNTATSVDDAMNSLKRLRDRCAELRSSARRSGQHRPTIRTRSSRWAIMGDRKVDSRSLPWASRFPATEAQSGAPAFRTIICAGAGTDQPAATCWVPDEQLRAGKNPAWG